MNDIKIDLQKKMAKYSCKFRSGKDFLECQGNTSDRFYFKIQKAVLNLGKDDVYLWIYPWTENFDKDKVIWNGRIVLDDECAYMFFWGQTPDSSVLHLKYSTKDMLVASILEIIDTILAKRKRHGKLYTEYH